MKTKRIFLTLSLLFIASLSNAQDKFEYAIIDYNTKNHSLNISINGVKFTQEEITLPKEERDIGNANPLLKKVNEYQDSDWEVMSFDKHSFLLTGNSVGEICSAFLRKRKTDKK